MSWMSSISPLTIPIFVVALLLIASATCWGLKGSRLNSTKPALVDEICRRTWAWWLMALIVLPAVCAGFYTTLALFFIISLLALREYLSLLDTGPAHHRALFWSFALVLPTQFTLVGIDWYGMYSIFIPVYAFVFIPAAIVLRGSTERFLEHTATIQWGLMAGVYFISYLPALFLLPVIGMAHPISNLILFLIVVAQLSDVFQFICGKLFGKRRIAPTVSPNKTWEGLIGGALCSSGIGAALGPLTPFGAPIGALMAAGIVAAGFLGGLVMSAVKRDRGVKDYGALIPGHGGVLDRIDSLIFSAPIFFHVVRYYYTP